MDRLIGVSVKRVRHCSWHVVPALMVVLLSLFAAVFANDVPRVHATNRPLHNKSISTIGMMRYPLHRGHPLQHSLQPSRHVQKIAAISLNKAPDLTLTRTTLLNEAYRSKHELHYVLSVSNGYAAGRVEAGNTITISNAIPAGLTGVTTHAKNSDWRLKLGGKPGSSMLTATYVGAYPVLPGARLSPIMVYGTLGHSAPAHIFIPALVHTKYANQVTKNGAQLKEPGHGFIVKGSMLPQTSPYQVGQNVTYTLSITNDSAAGPVLSGDAITVTDTIPAGLTGLTASAASSDWTVSLAATTSPTTLTATYVGTYPVAAGATLSPITINGTLTSSSMPQVANSAVVVTPNDNDNSNNTGTNTVTVVAQPDLTVTNTVPTGVTFQVGKPVTYTITGSDLSSAGPVLAGDAITITDAIPAGLTGMTASATSTDWTVTLGATSGATTLTATYIGTYPVAAGTSLSPITLTGTLTSVAIPQVVTTATISTPHDSNAANNTAANTITVVAQPDLTVTKTVPAGTTLQIGHTVTYTITASNGSSAGPVIAGDAITITDSIPAGITGMTTTATSSDWTVTLGATTSPTTLTATYVGTYPVAANTTLSPITLSGTLTATSYPTLANTATVSTPNDSNAANDSATSTNAVLKRPDLSLTKTIH